MSTQVPERLRKVIFSVHLEITLLLPTSHLVHLKSLRGFPKCVPVSFFLSKNREVLSALMARRGAP
jgi:hypothetical protein